VDPRDKRQTPLEQTLTALLMWSYAAPFIAMALFAQNPPAAVMLLSTPR